MTHMQSSLARGKWIEAFYELVQQALVEASSLARGKWIEACKIICLISEPCLPSQEGSGLKHREVIHNTRLTIVFPRKREVD